MPEARVDFIKERVDDFARHRHVLERVPVVQNRFDCGFNGWGNGFRADLFDMIAIVERLAVVVRLQVASRDDQVSDAGDLTSIRHSDVRVARIRTDDDVRRVKGGGDETCQHKAVHRRGDGSQQGHRAEAEHA